VLYLVSKSDFQQYYEQMVHICDTDHVWFRYSVFICDTDKQKSWWHPSKFRSDGWNL